MLDQSRINNTMGKMYIHLKNHNSICVGVSGGSDSNIIVHIIATYFRQFLPKIHFVFCNTGLEYRATLKHLDYMEKHYNIHIDRIRGESVVNVIKREGVPILSKEFSLWVYQAQKGNAYGLKRLARTREESPYGLNEKQKALADYLMENNIKVSSKCCDLSKKKPNKKYLKEHKCDLTISGERQAEGGVRATRYHDCFLKGNEKKIDKYMPLFYWNDETKQWYKEHENICYSDCYEVWGMKRTGCVGCPFNSRAGEYLKLIKQYEPNLYKACMNVFGESYKLMDMFDVHRHKILEDEEQISFSDILGGSNEI